MNDIRFRRARYVGASAAGSGDDLRAGCETPSEELERIEDGLRRVPGDRGSVKPEDRPWSSAARASRSRSSALRTASRPGELMVISSSETSGGPLGWIDGLPGESMPSNFISACSRARSRTSSSSSTSASLTRRACSTGAVKVGVGERGAGAGDDAVDADSTSGRKPAGGVGLGWLLVLDQSALRPAVKDIRLVRFLSVATTGDVTVDGAAEGAGLMTSGEASNDDVR